MRQGMQSVGQLVEKAIGKAQKAKATVVAGSGAPVTMTLETLFGIPKLKELLTLSANRLIPPFVPALAERAVLEIAEGTGKFAPLLKEHGAKVVAALELGGGLPPAITDSTRQLYVIRANLRRLPFADNHFYFCIANLATPQQGDLLRSLKEISRVMVPGGHIIVTDFHPFGAYAKRGSTRLKPMESTLRGIGDYFKVARMAGLQVVDLREAFIDETMRAIFTTPEEKNAYRTLKENPVMACLIARKGVIDAL